MADNLEIIANGTILTGNITMSSGGAITSTAGKKISNTTGQMVADLVSGINNNKAGDNQINIALGKITSHSGANTISGAPMIFNTTADNIESNGKGGVNNIGLIIANTASELIENSSGGSVKQKADLAIMENSLKENNYFKESTKEALMVKDQGNMVVNE